MKRFSRRYGAVALLSAAALTLSACGGGGDEALSSEDTITVTLGGDPLTMSPFDLRAGVNLYGSSQMYERLLARDDDGEIIPWLAEDWDVSNEGRTYTFNLRDDVTFHNGEPMTSADVKFSYERYTDPEISAFAWMLGDLETIDTPDEHTIVLTFTEPKPLLISSLGATFIVPASIADESADFLDTQAIGTGPFEMTDRQPGQGFDLERFDDYWGEPAGFSAIDVQINPDANARVSALRSGQSDFIVPVPAQNIDQLESEFNVVTANDSNSVGIAFNLDDPEVAGVVDDPKVRKALDLAIDRQAVVDSALNGNGIVHGGIGPQSPGSDDVEATEYDPEEAKRLISEAGAEGEQVALYVPKNGRVTNSEQVGQAVAGYWDEAGVATDLRIVSYEEWIDRLTGPAQTYLTFMGDEIAGSPIVRFRHFYSCDGGASQICDEGLDDLVATALAAPTLDDATAANVAAFDYLNENALGISMYVQEGAFAMQKSICWEPIPGVSIPNLATLQPCGD